MLQKVRFALIITLELSSFISLANLNFRKNISPQVSFTPPNIAYKPQPPQTLTPPPTPAPTPQQNNKPNSNKITNNETTSVNSALSAPKSHPNYQYTALVSTSNPLYAMEPFVNRLGAPAGLNAAVSSSSIAPIIAVIDTGFGMAHNNLQSLWATDSSEMGPSLLGSAQNCTNQGLVQDKRCNNYDNNNDGYPSNWRGWDFVGNDNDPSTGSSNPYGSSVAHGTLTASLAAVLNPNVKIMPLQALDDAGVGYTDTVAAAVRYAADHGATVISLSLGSPYDDSYLRAEINYAISKGIVVVAAAGNSGCNCLSYPAAYPEVLSVGATTSSDQVASFSSYGASLAVVAPGTANDVCGALWTPANQTSSYSCNYSGTSFAAPIVASLASLLQMQSPVASPGDIIRLITQNTDKPAGMGGQGRTLQYGYGRISIYKSILAASLASPKGQLLNKNKASLSAADIVNGPLLNSTCQGEPGASCNIRITSSDGNTVKYLGSQTLDEWGGANFIWNAASVGLSVGQWKVESIISYLGQTTTKPPLSLDITP